MNGKHNADMDADRTAGRGGVTAADLLPAILKTVTLKSRLGLEYDKIIILAAIACRQVLRADRPDGPAGLSLAAEGSLRATNGSTMSLARILGIPRETVRRKLMELCDEGWLMPGGRSGHFQPSERLLRILAEAVH